MTAIAVMQPYFLPYAGYFRLFAMTDLFVVFDCVQFPRRGWVHRNRLRDRQGAPRWLTLPLAPAPREVAIRDLRYRPDGAAEMTAQTRRFPLFDAPAAAAAPLAHAASTPDALPVDHLCTTLGLACRALGLPFNVVRSSTLGIDPALRGGERIVAIAATLGAKRYLNPPGGRALYDPAEFRRHGLRLQFLPPYEGPVDSILQRLHDDGGDRLRREIEANCRGSAA